MLRKIRIFTASAFFLFTSLLFLDFSGMIHLWFGWLAKIQLVPVILAVNVAVLVIFALLTVVFGRIYCSVVCPLGVLQDGISNLSGRRKRKKKRFRYAPAKTWLRYVVFVLFVVALCVGGGALVSLLDPYAAYGRIASNFFSPLYDLGNNLLAWLAERMDSYAFYATELRLKSWLTFSVATTTLLVVGILAWRHGRTYCNTICPVGTFLGFISKFSLFRLTLNESKCTKCKACERICKSSCIDVRNMNIDHSRCVTCFNCINKCQYGGIKYAPLKFGKKTKKAKALAKNTSKTERLSRRNALSLLGMMGIASTLKAQELHVDGGLAEIEDKKIPSRKVQIVPPGALGVQNMKDKCTACQLCVSACPNNVLRPSEKLATFMQVQMSFEEGYCRPECVKCSEVCPTTAISPITTADKSAIAIGHAVWVKENCVVNRDEVQCDNCEYHCPTSAIVMIDRDSENGDSLKIPVIDKSLCIGCGACEFQCPARPFSAIYVEGNVRHHLI